MKILQRDSVRASVVGVLVLMLFAALSSTAAASVASISTVDSGVPDLSNAAFVRTTITNGGDPSMQFDADGNPIIAYTDHVNATGSLWLVNCDDPACSGEGETISRLDPVANGNHTSMQLDRDGNPVIVYKGIDGAQPNPGDLRMIRCNDPACAGGDDPIVVLVESGAKRFAELRLDADDNPVVLFRTFTFSDHSIADINLLHCNDPLCAGGDDPISPLRKSTHKANGRASLELDPDGFPVIAYSGQWDALNGASSMTLVQCNDVNCAGDDENEVFVGEDLTHPDIELVPTGDGYDIVLAAVKFNFQAQPRQWRFGLHASTCASSDCQFEHFSFPDTLVDSPHTISLAVTADGPVIAYPRDGSLRLATLNLENPVGFYALRDVVSVAPDPDAQGSIKPSFMLDPDGRAAVAYLADDALKLVQCGNSGCIPTCNGLPITVDGAAGDLGSPRNDIIRGSAGDDVIDGLGGDDIICGLGGNDILVGGDGFDKIFAGAGNDQLWGGAGNDRLVGGVGNDTIIGDIGNDRLLGGPGNDQLSGAGGTDRISGGSGNDTISGGAGGDTIFGNLGRDMIDGGAGDDIIKGGAWLDDVDGGAGNDRCGIVEEEVRVNCERGVFGI